MFQSHRRYHVIKMHAITCVSFARHFRESLESYVVSVYQKYKFARFDHALLASEEKIKLRDPAHGVTIIDAEKREKRRKRWRKKGRKKGTGGGEREDYAESVGVTTFGMYFPLRCPSENQSAKSNWHLVRCFNDYEVEEKFEMSGILYTPRIYHILTYYVRT